MLSALEINPQKAMNSCHNDFNAMSRTYNVCVQNKSTRNKMIELGFDIGETVWSGKAKMYCLLSPQNNLKKIIALADGEYPHIKQKITEESYYAHGNFDEDNIEKRFASHKKTAIKLLPILSDVSLVNHVISNREANMALIQDAMQKYKNTAKVNRKLK